MILLVLAIIILIFSAVIHEVAHGAVADLLGDPTAKYAGRLTLNPLKHLDPIGSVVLPLALILLRSPILFASAKPVPINPYNFRDQKYGMTKSALAGPTANLILALAFGFLIRIFPLASDIKNGIISSIFQGNSENLSHLIQGNISASIFSVFVVIVFINIVLSIFNLLPIPPLDGSHVLFTFLPLNSERFKIFLAQYGLLILIFLIFFFPPLLHFISYIISSFFFFITGAPFS